MGIFFLKQTIALEWNKDFYNWSRVLWESKGSRQKQLAFLADAFEGWLLKNDFFLLKIKKIFCDIFARVSIEYLFFIYPPPLSECPVPSMLIIQDISISGLSCFKNIYIFMHEKNLRSPPEILRQNMFPSKLFDVHFSIFVYQEGFIGSDIILHLPSTVSTYTLLHFR